MSNHYDLTQSIAFEGKVTFAIRTASNGDTYVLPPYVSYGTKTDRGEHFRLQFTNRFEKPKAKFYYASRHTDEQGNNSLYWAYKHVILDLIKDTEYRTIACENHYNATTQDDKITNEIYTSIGLPNVRGVILSRKPSGKINIALYYGGRFHFSTAAKGNVLQGIRLAIARSPDEWKASRVIPEMYL